MKSAIEPRIKSFVEFRLQHYHEDKRQLREYYYEKMPSSVADYSGNPHGGGDSRPSEALGISLATDTYILTSERTLNAIERVLKKLDGETLKLISLVYWRGSHTVVGAAMAMNMHPSTAYRKLNKAIKDIALELGYVSI